MWKSVQCVLVLPQTAPLAAETHCNFGHMLDDSEAVVKAWVRGGTCWKAGGKTEAEKMKSHPSIYVPGFFFISKEGGRVDLVFF